MCLSSKEEIEINLVDQVSCGKCFLCILGVVLDVTGKFEELHRFVLKTLSLELSMQHLITTPFFN